jgi:hypothetical protein
MTRSAPALSQVSTGRAATSRVLQLWAWNWNRSGCSCSTNCCRQAQRLESAQCQCCPRGQTLCQPCTVAMIGMMEPIVGDISTAVAGALRQMSIGA